MSQSQKHAASLVGTRLSLETPRDCLRVATVVGVSAVEERTALTWQTIAVPLAGQPARTHREGIHHDRRHRCLPASLAVS